MVASYRQVFRILLGLFFAGILPAQASSSRIDVFVSLNCESCYNLQYFINQQSSMALDIHFIPAVSWPSWRFYAKLYLSLEKINREDLLLDAYHEVLVTKDKKKQLEDWEAWLAQKQVSFEDFKNIFFSFELNSELNDILARQKQHAISSVPAILINDDTILPIENTDNARSLYDKLKSQEAIN